MTGYLAIVHSRMLTAGFNKPFSTQGRCNLHWHCTYLTMLRFALVNLTLTIEC